MSAKTNLLEKKLKLEDLAPGFISPRQVAGGWNVGIGDKAADLGCGGGYFTIPLAYLVGEKGKVYAVDVMEGPVEAVRSKVFLEKLNNVEVIRANLEKKSSLSAWIKPGSCQHVVVANTLYTTRKKKAILDEAKRILEPKGQLIVIDWIEKVGDAFRNFGPPVELRLSEREVKSLVAKVGFTFVDKFEAGQFHYGLIFRKK
jgi:ubiquinone/menaquinone biosynthesis C-methylase UbiE